MTRKIIVKAWHERLSDDLACVLDGFCTMVNSHYEWTFDGTLSEFVQKWDRDFIAFRNDIENTDYYDWMVGITQK